MERKSVNKFYILSTPASGKTTFIKDYAHLYQPLKFYDFDHLKPHRDFRALAELPANSVALGGLAGKGIKFDPEQCFYVAVILPKPVLLKRIEARRKDCSWGIWPFRFRKKNQEGTGWDSKERILQSHEELTETTRQYEIPAFSSFAAACDYLLEKL